MTSYRRIVTGLDPHGRSCVVTDQRIVQQPVGDTHLWMRQPGEHDLGVDQEVPFFPKPGQSVFRIVRLSPPDSSQSAAQIAASADGFFTQLGSAWCRVDTTRDAFMHRTPTTDYITVLSGRVSLLLETGEAIALNPMDSVVQRQTNHAWIVTGAEPAILLCVMVGELPADERSGGN